MLSNKNSEMFPIAILYNIWELKKKKDKKEKGSYKNKMVFDALPSLQ